MSELRNLPSVDKLLQIEGANTLIDEYGRPLTIDAFRHILDAARSAFRETGQIPSEYEIFEQVEALLNTWASPTLRPVINASGVMPSLRARSMIGVPWASLAQTK